MMTLPEYEPIVAALIRAGYHELPAEARRRVDRMAVSEVEFERDVRTAERYERPKAL